MRQGNRTSYICPCLFRANTSSLHFGLQKGKRGRFVQRNKYTFYIRSASTSRQDQRSVGLGPLGDAFTMIYLSFREQRGQEKGFLSFLSIYVYPKQVSNPKISKPHFAISCLVKLLPSPVSLIQTKSFCFVLFCLESSDPWALPEPRKK